MSILVDIEKEMGGFLLKAAFETDCDRIGILGASGSGKSLTLKAIAGIATPDRGVIRVNGRTLFDSEKGINVKTKDRHIGYLFQNYALFPRMTVEKNIAAGLLSGDKAGRQARVDEMIAKFQLQGLEKRLPGQLSGGQQQRVALARIMAYSPDVILLDEPFSALDMFLKDHLQQELINSLSEYSGTSIMVSHDRDEIYRFSNRLLIVDSGRVICSGATKDIFRKPGYKAAAKLTGCKNFAEIVIRSTYTAYAPSWDLEITTTSPIPENARYIGYRAHDFIPVWGERRGNCIPFDSAGMSELQFERKYYIRTAEKSENIDSCISWFLPRARWNAITEKGLPDYLLLDEKKMMFLR